MKKSLLAVLLAVAMVAPAFAESKINLYGQLDVYGYQTDGTWGWSGYAGGYSDTTIRAFVGANFGLTQNIEGNFALLYGRYWGNTQIEGTTANDFLDQVKIAEANIVFNNLFDNDKITAKVGRYFYGEEGDTMFYFGLHRPEFIICPWSYSSFSNESGVDGLLLTYNDREKLKVDAGYAKLSTLESSSYKESLFFAKANYKFNDKYSLKAYYFDYESYNNSSNYKYKQENIGLKPQANFLDNKLKTSVEFVQQFWDGGDTSRRFQNYAECWFAKADISYDILDNLDVRGMYFRSGKDFYAENDNIYVGLWTTWKTLNYGCRDCEALNFGADYKLGKFTFIADYFRLNDDLSSYYHPKYELDAQIKYNYTEDISFKLGAAWLAYEDGHGDGGDSIYVFGGSWKFDTKIK